MVADPSKTEYPRAIEFDSNVSFVSTEGHEIRSIGIANSMALAYILRQIIISHALFGANTVPRSSIVAVCFSLQFKYAEESNYLSLQIR